MKEKITTHLLRFDFHDISLCGWGLLVFLGVMFLFVIFLFFMRWKFDLSYDLFCSEWELICSMGLLVVLTLVTLFGMFIPISVTQRTCIQTETFQILEKRSTSNTLELLVKDQENVVSVKKIDFTQENVEVKVHDKSDSYITTTERVTYKGHPCLRFFKNVPESTVKTTVSLPQKFLNIR